MSDGITAESTEVVAEEEASQVEGATAEQASPETEQPTYDSLADAAFSEEETAPEAAEPEPAGEPGPEAAAGAAEADQPEAEASGAPHPEQEEDPTQEAKRFVIDDEDATLVDKDGNEYRAGDVVWRTQQLHRKLSEKDQEVKKWEPFERRFEHDPEGLIADIAKAKAPHLMPYLSQALQEAQQAGDWNPVEGQQRMLEAERKNLEQERRNFQLQQQANEELATLKSELGREPNQQEQQYMNAVYDKWRAAYSVNPNTPCPSLKEAYRLAVNALEYDRLHRPPPPQPKPQKPTVERPTNTATVDRSPTYEELADAALRHF